MNIIEFDNGAFKDEKYGTKKYGLTNLTTNSILQQYCDKLSYIKGMYDYQKPLNEMHGPIMGLLDPFVGYNFENMGTYITYGVRDRLWWIHAIICISI